MSAPTDYRLKNQGQLPNAWKISAGLAGLGLLLAGAGYGMDPHRFGYSYLFGFAVTLTVFFGALFFVVSQHITQGHWSVSTRRIAELLLSGAPVVAVFGLVLLGGVAAGQFDMYKEWLDVAEGGGHHASVEHEHVGLVGGTARAQEGEGHAAAADHGDHAAAGHGEGGHEHTPQMARLHHEVLAHKVGYLNKGRFLGFGVAYILIWVGLAYVYYKKSVEQDSSKDKQITVKLKSFSYLGAVLFGLTLTFASFDWMMSLQPAWYSTIYGVVIFGGSAMTVFALLVLISIALIDGGHVGDAISVEHVHDHAKLMFGFMCFWTYVSFSQWMLIWYAGIPEEAVFYQARWTGGWEVVSKLLPICHFALPFVVFISREVKRRTWAIKLVALWLLFWHVVDIYWQVMPTGTPHLAPGIGDVGCLLLIGGSFFALVFKNMGQVALIPVGDPRLERTLHHHQTY